MNLPLIEAAGRRGPDGSSPPHRRGAEVPRILVVDDERAVRKLLRRMLEREGYEVETVADGETALEALPRFHPDVILLDLRIPGLDGLEVCRAVRLDPNLRLTPILVLTGVSDLEDRVEALDAGADDFLSKPPERLELLARIRSLVRLRRQTAQLVQAESVVLSLARSVERKDRSTEYHCERLGALGVELGRRLGLPWEDLEALRVGGVLHDVGKVGVPDSILLKNGELTPEEWQVMREHPQIGEYICSPIHSFASVLPIIRHHHEKMDGTGYPEGLTGSDIPITARVLQIVDVYDALTSERSYKTAHRHDEAMSIMKAEVARGWWDPAVYEEFESMLDSAKRVAGREASEGARQWTDMLMHITSEEERCRAS